MTLNRLERTIAWSALGFFLASCAVGDQLFTDAVDATSGRREAALEAQQAVVEHEQLQGREMTRQSEELRRRQAALEGDIAAERSKARELDVKLAELNSEIEARRSESAQLRAKELEIQVEIQRLTQEISQVQAALAVSPQPAELEALKQNLRELEEEYADLFAVYQTL